MSVELNATMLTHLLPPSSTTFIVVVSCGGVGLHFWNTDLAAGNMGGPVQPGTRISYFRMHKITALYIISVRYAS